MRQQKKCHFKTNQLTVFATFAINDEQLTTNNPELRGTTTIRAFKLNDRLKCSIPSRDLHTVSGPTGKSKADGPSVTKQLARAYLKKGEGRGGGS